MSLPAETAADADVGAGRPRSLTPAPETSTRGRVKFALLALLVSEPSHGYDLKGRWEEILGDIWPLNPSQIYTTLGQMEREGLVDTEIIPQEAMPPRKLCRLTPKGREALSAWLFDTVAGPQQLRDDFVLKILFAMTPEVAAEFPPLDTIKRHRSACLRSLKELQEVQNAALDPASQLLIEATMIRLEGNVRWLELCEEKLRARR